MVSIILCHEYFRIEETVTVYTSEKHGNDETGDGSESKPFQTALQVQTLIHQSEIVETVSFFL